MKRTHIHLELDHTLGGVICTQHQAEPVNLHPLWLRERVNTEDVFDYTTRQRLYETSDLPLDIRVESAVINEHNQLALSFSDGYASSLPIEQLERELGWIKDPISLPTATPWTAADCKWRTASWQEIDTPQNMKNVLQGFFKDGFCLITQTPTQKDSLLTIAKRFGYLRETNFGSLFNVMTKPQASDLAYTNLPLSSHTDNPYREPIPGIQFLHCLQNESKGGLGTLADGLSIAQSIRQDAPDEFDILTQTSVRFIYQGPSAILTSEGPLIELDSTGNIVRVRLSSRLDYVPPLEPQKLSLFYAARQRLAKLANDAAFLVSFTYEPGLLLMMDNYRLLHGRTAYEDGGAGRGYRHLQGCYIDHDGIRSLYRMLAQDGKTTSVRREED